MRLKRLLKSNTERSPLSLLSERDGSHDYELITGMTIRRWQLDFEDDMTLGRTQTRESIYISQFGSASLALLRTIQLLSLPTPARERLALLSPHSHLSLVVDHRQR